jgi:hypothetical protein
MGVENIPLGLVAIFLYQPINSKNHNRIILKKETNLTMEMAH